MNENDNDLFSFYRSIYTPHDDDVYEGSNMITFVSEFLNFNGQKWKILILLSF